VDNVVNNPHLTAENAFNGGGFNKMPNPKADFLLNQIKGLQDQSFSRRSFLRPLEKYFSVHK
jgi:hypothetical protein